MKNNRLFIAFYSAVGLIIIAVLLIALAFCQNEKREKRDKNANTWKIPSEGK